MVAGGVDDVGRQIGANAGRTFYTPYDSTYMPGPSRLPFTLGPFGFRVGDTQFVGATGWLLVILGGVLLALTFAKRRFAFWSLLAYTIAIIAELASSPMGAPDTGPRFHYYFYTGVPPQTPGQALHWIAWVMLAIGLIFSVGPSLLERFNPTAK
jgi:hypothetical protein